jgi:ABC-type polar amino acid transport system ATPase subunit
MIEVKNVFKKFGNNTILKDVSMNVEEGEKVVIIGPSGSRKIYFIKMP